MPLSKFNYTIYTVVQWDPVYPDPKDPQYFTEHRDTLI